MTDKDSDIPAMYEHCKLIYETMLEQAKPYGDGEMSLWEGSLTGLFEDVGLGISRYTSVTKLLQKMGCLEQKHRGGGPVPSQWVVIKDPDLETFEYAKQQLKYEQRGPDPMEQRVNDLNRRLSAVEEQLASSDT